MTKVIAQKNLVFMFMGQSDLWLALSWFLTHYTSKLLPNFRSFIRRRWFHNEEKSF